MACKGLSQPSHGRGCETQGRNDSGQVAHPPPGLQTLSPQPLRRRASLSAETSSCTAKGWALGGAGRAVSQLCHLPAGHLGQVTSNDSRSQFPDRPKGSENTGSPHFRRWGRGAHGTGHLVLLASCPGARGTGPPKRVTCSGSRISGIEVERGCRTPSAPTHLGSWQQATPGAAGQRVWTVPTLAHVHDGGLRLK